MLEDTANRGPQGGQKSWIRRKGARLLGVSVCTLAGAAALAAYAPWGTLQALAQRGVHALDALPAWTLLPALAFLPPLGVPISPLYVLAGLRLSAPQAALTLSAGISTSLFLSYALARWPLRRLALRLLPENAKTLVLQKNPPTLRFILWLRLAPLPFIVQNTTLGLLNTPALRYMAASVPIQLLIGAVFAYFGRSAQAGQLLQVLLAVFLVLSLQAGVAYLRRRRGRGEGVPPAGRDASLHP